jgi:hypothetical protein
LFFLPESGFVQQVAALALDTVVEDFSKSKSGKKSTNLLAGEQGIEALEELVCF